MTLGIPIGKGVGLVVGSDDGAIVGLLVGTPEGALLDLMDDENVGDPVGVAIGVSDGNEDCVGVTDGIPE